MGWRSPLNVQTGVVDVVEGDVADLAGLVLQGAQLDGLGGGSVARVGEAQEREGVGGELVQAAQRVLQLTTGAVGEGTQ